MKKNLSYLWPFTKTVDSKFSGRLEITWTNGRKVLDSPNANYSYGALHEVLDRGLAEFKVDRSAPVLLLGLGGGSAIHLLREKYNYYGKITAVELDPKVIDIAYKEFDLKQYEPLEVICADALEFVKQASKTYVLIIVDLFLDLKVPDQFFTSGFWNNISQILEEKGSVLFNAGINSAHHEEIEMLLKKEDIGIDFRRKDAVYGSNTLLFGRKR